MPRYSQKVHESGKVVLHVSKTLEQSLNKYLENRQNMQGLASPIAMNFWLCHLLIQGLQQEKFWP